jgi:hypothetical protein
MGNDSGLQGNQGLVVGQRGSDFRREGKLRVHHRFWICDFGFAILDLRFWICDFGFAILDLRFWICDFGFAILDLRFWIVDLD